MRLTAPEALHVQVEDPSAFAETYTRLQGEYPDARTWRVRGDRMATARAAFDELGAALQLPYYFGGNWAALEDCLLDLDWAPATDYLLLVCDAHLALADEPDQLPSLLGSLVRAHEAWQPRSFRTVLQVPAGADDALWSRLAQAGQATAV
ncbi:barstar family protein [Nocardioides dongxiaopingii]|uniref:barstar family protein n=1 Tax=Nocardioides sp. S-1144 TaxID=2582905 RepID=UPI00110ED923|nr:barstar family protein [Nocardioides sp. S-1144]QCW51951.1 barstar family protein [Nocardioides sp. S-1144]